MKKTSCKLLSLLLVLVMLLSAMPLALAEGTVTPLRAYCYGLGVNSDASGAPTGFRFTVGAQYGAAPYTLSYAIAGPVAVSGNVSAAGTVNASGNFTTGDYTVTVTAKDAANAASTAVMKFTFTRNEDNTYSTKLLSAVAPESKPVVKVNKITLSETTINVRAGSTAQLTAAIEPDNADNRAVLWQSSDPSVATVDATGLVTGLKAGNCKITCTAADGSGVSASAVVYIVQPVLGISLTPASLTVSKGGTAKLTPAVSPATAANKEVTFTSGNTAVVVVANDGTVTGVNEGVAVVTVASVDDPAKKATCTVTVGLPVTGVTMSMNAASITTGTSLTLSAKVAPDNATNQALIWSSSDAAVASVNAFGIVTAWKAGTATITATAADGSGKFGATVITVTGDAVQKPSDKPDDQPTTDATKPTTPSTGTPSTGTPEQPRDNICYVKISQGTTLNLREKPSTNSRVLARIPMNDTFVALESISPTWLYVTYNGIDGYVMQKYVSAKPTYNGKPIESETPDTSKPEVVPTSPITNLPYGTGVYIKITQGSTLNLREKPSINAKILQRIPKGERFTYIKQHNDTWSYVYYLGDYGYAMTKYLTFSNPETTKPEVKPTDTTPVVKPTDTTETLGTGYVKITQGSTLNLRQNPSINAKVVDRIEKDHSFTVMKSYNSTWYYVSYEGQYGYVMKKFVSMVPVEDGKEPGGDEKPSTPVTPPTGDGVYAQVYTETGGLNLRTGMGKGYTRIAVIPQNAYVDVLVKGADWCQVSYNGKTGYVMTIYLKFI